MRLNKEVTLYNIRQEYDPDSNETKEIREYVSKKIAQVEEMSGNLYYKEYGVFKRGIIRVAMMQHSGEFTHIEYNGKYYSVVDMVIVKNRAYITAEVV